MRMISAILVATAMTVSGAYAETGFAPGKPAGVKQAELGTIGLPVLSIAGLIGFGALLYSVSHSDSTPTPAAPVVTSTSTSP